SNGALDPSKLADFARQNVPQLPDARRLLDEALAHAAREHKNVLLDESAPYCGWCVKLTDYLDANRAVIDKYFVRVTLDRRFAGGKQIMERLRSPKLDDRYSTPWTAILSPDQRVLITTDASTGNIGYPGEPGGREHWKKILRTGAPQMTESELAGL